MQPYTCYLICGTPRCGSSLLAEALGNTGVAGYPAEYFWREDEPIWAEQWDLQDYTYAGYLAAALHHGTTPNGVFGAKMMWWDYFDVFLRKARTIPGCSDLDAPVLLSHLFPNLRYIWLSRRDTVRQGISHWKAIQTGVWGSTGDARTASTTEPIYDFEAIHHLVQGAIEGDASWHDYFARHDIRPFHVVYEEFIERYEDTLVRALHFLDLPTPRDLGVNGRRLRKQADDLSERWARQYLETVSQ